MRTHGWAGSPPSNDDEALTRLLDAARTIIDRYGRAPRFAELARDLGVSRGTIYRYIRDGDDLLEELAARETGPFVEGLKLALAGEVEPARAVVRAVLHVVDQLPRNPYIALAFADGSRAVSITSAAAQAFGREILGALDVDWSSLGFDDELLRSLVEQMLRLVQSFVIDPGEPPRHGAQLEAYLETWLAPNVEAIIARRPSAAH